MMYSYIVQCTQIFLTEEERLALDAAAVRENLRPLTRNVRHFPMFADLTLPY